jgi:hypothetical protein
MYHLYIVPIIIDHRIIESISNDPHLIHINPFLPHPVRPPEGFGARCTASSAKNGEDISIV